MTALVDTEDGLGTTMEVTDPPIRKILVADDDPLYRLLLQRRLSSHGYFVQLVRNGAEALEAAQATNAARLLVLDWVMPLMQGPEVCRRLRDLGDEPYRYTLLLTSKDRTDDIIEGLAAGADDYLTKPFDFQELMARIHVGTRILELHDRLIATQEQLRYHATHDALTGVFSRGALVELLSKEAERARRLRSDFCVLMFDLDNFKQVNDRFGHMTGDVVLCAVAARLVASVRSYDLLGRYGGEEFLVGASSLGAEGPDSYAERLRATISNTPVETPNGPVAVTTSIGVASSQVSGYDVEKLLRKADEALYVAKGNGRNRVEVA